MNLAEPVGVDRPGAGPVVLHPLDLAPGTPQEVGRPARDAIEAALSTAAPPADPAAASLDRALPTGRPVLVVDATLLGPRVPARERVVAAIRRGGTVMAETLAAGRVTRVVRVGSVDLLDAGAQDAGPGLVAFPPDDPAAAAALLRDSLDEGIDIAVDVVLASRATPDRVPVTLAVAGAPGARACAPLLNSVETPAVIVTGLPSAEACDGQDMAGRVDAEAEHSAAARAHPPRSPRVVGGIETIRTAFDVPPGTPAAIEVGLPAAGDDVETRIARACRLAARPFREVPDRHPVRKHVRSGIDVTAVTMTTLQIGVRVDAPDDLTLGAAVGRLIVALSAEGIAATPVRHDTGPHGSAVLVAFLGDEG